MTGNTNVDRTNFPVVALCASAGGLEAYQTFFDAMPSGSGMAFIVVQHQHYQQGSILNTIIQRGTPIPVLPIGSAMPIEPDHIYVLPSGFEAAIHEGRFELKQITHGSGWPATIDRFLESLARDQGERVAAIILSGAGSDGAAGTDVVKAMGGMVIAQDPETATQAMMPLSVIEAGLADAVLHPALMPGYLFEAFRIGAPLPPTDRLVDVISEADLYRLVRRLRRQTGRSFEEYKTSTMRRQTARRMSTLQLESVDAYMAYMDDHPEEADRLTHYLLINVTGFFRDPEAFESLKRNALMPLLQTMDIDTIFRAWVPGCATGQEAVSIAILIHECLRELDMPDMEVRIFASDANRDLVQQARRGVYPASIHEEISANRLRDHFQEEEDGYRVRNHITRMIIWSEHNLVEHPPFSQLHLISCRNVLIYFQRRLQNRVLSLFHFALRPEGILFLGSSETMPFSSDEFATVDSKQKIYRRAAGISRAWLQLDQPLFRELPMHTEEAMTSKRSREHGDGDYKLRIVKDMLVEYYDPTCIIVDENYHIRYSYGEVDRYLRVVPGDNIQYNVLEMAREGLDADLTIALHEAFTDDDETITRQGVWVKTNGDERIIDLVVKPIRDNQLGNRLKLVIFHLKMMGTELRSTEPITDMAEDEPNAVITRLRQDLKQTQDVLQSTTQALQAKSEELTTSMEEIRSANEEVQTTNEELRTSKEELESMNEELNTLNTQLTDQNHELTRAKNTLHNFLQSTEIGMIFLDQNLRIREYTTAVTNIFGLRRSDLGRPLGEIAAQVIHEDLMADATFVLDTLKSVEKEVRATDGSWYNLRIRPYRTTSNVIDGLVLTFTDISVQKQDQADTGPTAYLREVGVALDQILIELDSDLRVQHANPPFYAAFGLTEEETVGQRLLDVGGGQWRIPALQELLTTILPDEETVHGFELTHDFPGEGRRRLRINARRVPELERIVLVIADQAE